VPDFLKGLLARLFGSSDEEPMGSVSADQVAILLKSIEDKYTALQDENARLLARLEGRRDDRTELLERLAAQETEIATLRRALEARTQAETEAETAAEIEVFEAVLDAGPEAAEAEADAQVASLQEFAGG
jgi:septal ring factor EnvC (AmiA/AmiB activator)